MRLIIVGIDSGNNAPEPLDPTFPSGGRLAELMGVAPDDFLVRVDRTNLYVVPRSGASDEWAAANLLPLLRGRRVLILGRVVAEALGSHGPWMEWRVNGRGGFVSATFPHPSGRSTWWNDPQRTSQAGGFIRPILRPCIHVEGVDGSGKTTLIRDLAGLISLRVIPTDGPPSSWDECLARIDRRVAPGIICDRSSGLVSELVYGPVLRGGVMAPGGEDDLWKIVGSVIYSVIFVYCRPPRLLIAHEPRPGEDPDHLARVAGNLTRLYERYDEVMSRICRMGGRVMRYNWTTQDPEEVAGCVE